MKTVVVLSFLLVCYTSTCSQNLIFKKDKTIINCQIIKDYPNSIKIKLSDKPNEASKKIFKSDITKIQYSDGSIDIISASTISEVKWRGDTNSNYDSINYSIFYIVYNYGQSEDRPFPIYFNSTLIKKLNNHSRIKCKIVSEGHIRIYRNYNGRIGPSEELNLKHGQIYGIRIIVDPLNIRTWDPNKQFSIEIINDSLKLEKFLINDYYGFEPFKSLDYNMIEDLKKPIIKN